MHIHSAVHCVSWRRPFHAALFLGGAARPNYKLCRVPRACMETGSLAPNPTPACLLHLHGPPTSVAHCAAVASLLPLMTSLSVVVPSCCPATAKGLSGSTTLLTSGMQYLPTTNERKGRAHVDVRGNAARCSEGEEGSSAAEGYCKGCMQQGRVAWRGTRDAIQGHPCKGHAACRDTVRLRHGHAGTPGTSAQRHATRASASVHTRREHAAAGERGREVPAGHPPCATPGTGS